MYTLFAVAIYMCESMVGRVISRIQLWRCYFTVCFTESVCGIYIFNEAGDCDGAGEKEWE